jgi:uncharacterized protein YdaU (DUF1376 family)
MADLPWYRYFPGDFESATRTWTSKEVGVYIRLLNYQWLEGGIPLDEDRRARIAPDCAEVWEVVGDKFVERDGELINRRLEKERERLDERREKARQSANARWANSDANAYANAMRTQCYSDTDTDTEEEKKKNTRQKARNRWEIESYSLPDGMPTDDITLGALQSWLDYRKESRLKPYTSNRWIAGAWDRCGKSRSNLLAAINASLEHEYQGIYPEKSVGKKAHSGADERLTTAEKLERFGSVF